MKTFPIEPFIVHEKLIEDHRTDGLRSGEGTVASLADGSLLMLYGSFEGAGDDASASLVTRRSTDGGITWSERKLFCSHPAGALNVMSASLLRLSNGQLGCMYLLKNSLEDCRPIFITSDDHGKTWSPPVETIEKPGYFTVNNDRLIELSNHRLLAPFALYRGEPGHGECGCIYSDDMGKSWQIGEMIAIDKSLVLKPLLLDAAFPAGLQVYQERDVHAQEPGVIELLDGRVMMWARTSGGYAYRAFSNDGGQTWSPFTAISEFAMPCSPQSLQRLPGSKRIIMLFNERKNIPFCSPTFSLRKPLCIAVSDDDAKTWQRHGLLEPQSVPSNCYYSICAHDENMIFTYYEGAAAKAESPGKPPRNLASMKLKIVRREYFTLT